MARIPDAAVLGGRPTPGALLPVVNTQPTQTSRAMRQAGQVLAGIGEELHRRDVETQVAEARVALNDIEKRRIHDPDEGFAAKRGKDAIDGLKAFQDSYSADVDAAVARVKNNDARRIASDMAASRKAQTDQWASGHVLRERESYDEGTFMAGIASSLDRVSLDPATLKNEYAVQALATTARMKRKGRGAEEINVAVKELGAAMHGRVVDGMIARGQYELARQYFDKNIPAFGDKADEYGRRTAGAIEHDMLVKERLREQGERDVRRNAFRALEASDATQPVDTVLNAMTAQINEQPGLREQLEQRQRQRLKGLDIESDPREVRRLREFMGKDPKGFASADLTKSYPKLSIAHMDYFEQAQQQAKDPNKQAQFATEAQLLGQAYDEMKVPGGENGMAARGRFEELYFAEKRAFVKKNSREPSADEMWEIIKTLKLPFVKERWYGDKNKRMYELDGAEDASDFTVPADAREQIVQRNAAAGGAPLTEAQIRQAYILWKRK